MAAIELKIEGMSCEHCVARVESALAAVEGVSLVKVELEPGRAVVQAEGTSETALLEAVAQAGYTASAG